MAINFNANPYYDDYDQTKGYHRILFKPGVAVQARELTQSQTILQKQVERFGEHIFKNGSVVSGGQLFIHDSTYLNVSTDFAQVYHQFHCYACCMRGKQR